jgi:UDP-N-acetylglucosamine 2-epimerase
VTERPESWGLTSFLVKEPSDLLTMFNYHLNNYNDITGECPYGDGESSKKICKILKEIIIWKKY